MPDSLQSAVSDIRQVLSAERRHRGTLEPTATELPPEVAALALPEDYKRFLSEWAARRLLIFTPRFVDGLQLYGVDELLSGQSGYSTNAVTGAEVSNWPKTHLVIAQHSGDPFVLDLSQQEQRPSPVLFARHGEGSWRFKTAFPSFLAFLLSISRAHRAKTKFHRSVWLLRRPSSRTLVVINSRLGLALSRKELLELAKSAPTQLCLLPPREAEQACADINAQEPCVEARE